MCVLLRIFVFSLCLPFFQGCYQAERLAKIGDHTPLTPTQDPTAHKHYKPVKMPMPEPYNLSYAPNSLWRTGSKTFFKDQRAKRVGDILTILIHFDDKVTFTNKTVNSRTASNTSTLSKMFGLEKHLPKSVAADGQLVNTASGPQHEGKNEVNRKEVLQTQLAVTVTQKLPNGNFVVMGRQEVRMNFEIRELVLSGIIRPCDVKPDNTVDFKHVAEARLSYGGRGEGTDMQKTPYGQQALTQLLPF